MIIRRWVEEGATRFERHLLGSARADAPSAASRRAVRAALGIGIAAASGVVAVGATKASLTAGAIVKWIVVGALGGMAVVGPLAYRRWHAPEAIAIAPTATPPQAERPTAPLGATEAVLPPAPSPPETPATPAIAAAKPAHPSPAATEAPSETPPAVPGPSLADETAALDTVHAAVAGGQADRALALLGDYDRRFASGSLRAEAAVLRVQALLAAGRRDEAVQYATRWLAADPSSPHAARIRSLLEAAGR